MGATNGARHRYCRLASNCEEESTTYSQRKENRKMVWIGKMKIVLIVICIETVARQQNI